MLYPNSHTPHLQKELFESPTSEYRSTPFWAWNGKLNPERLSEQIHFFKKMGFGGFHMHVRTGMDSPYLTEEFMGYIRHCIDEAKDNQMLAWLYDEDRWPSGTAGGRVTAGKPEHARKSLLFTTTPYPEESLRKSQKPEAGRGQDNIRQENGVLLAIYDVTLNPDGTLKDFSFAEEKAPLPSGAVRWYAYMEYASADPWFNNQAYSDTLNPEAIDEFIELTHEAYYKSVGSSFGRTVPAIFTDEPQFTPKQPLNFAAEQTDIFLPWTRALPEIYEETYHENLLEHLPELFWELPEGKLSAVRWRFENLVTDLFVKTYCRKIGDWCREHNLYLTGHVMGEGSLSDQTQAVGDAMRCYRAFVLPGIDMLCDFHEYTTAKQTASIVHQNGAEGMLSELYGVTGWDYDFRGYKLQGDWQAALGVTVRVPHLAWMTMKGEAKRDYPASISYQSPWAEEFSMIEDHFARLNTALTRGKPVVRVAVVHPIESYWLAWGPQDQTALLREEMDRQFKELAETFLFHTIDFDYLCEAELPSFCEKGGNPLKVGKMAYDTIIVPPVLTLRSSTVQLLSAFVKEGGKLFFFGSCPAYVDACPSKVVEPLYQISRHLDFSENALLSALEEDRFLDVRRKDGQRENRLLHQLRREENSDLWLFVCTGKNPESPDVDPSPWLRFVLKGTYEVTLYDTLTGEIREQAVSYQQGTTTLCRCWHMHDSMLLLLHPAKEPVKKGVPALSPAAFVSVDHRFGTVGVSLGSPNMLLLDMAEYSFNGGDFYSEEELLRLDNNVRQELGIPIRRKEVVQAYLLEPETYQNFLRLRFRIASELPLSGLKLALEEPALAEISLNGEKVEVLPDGFYVDRDIRTVPLPDFKEGENILELKLPVGRTTNLEYFYLLGSFGVRVNGTKKTLTAPVSAIGWGDIVAQGLPFYTGTISYFVKIRSEADFTLRVPHYRGGVIKVLLDGEDCGNIAFSPYALTIHTEPGEHELELRLYTSRYNGFGQLHHTQGVYFYQSPNSWRSAGDLWSYEYHFRPSGILKSPELMGAVFLDEKGEVRRCSAYQAMHITDQS